MGSFLRDEYVKNISIDEKALQLFSKFFQDKEKEMNITLGNLAAQRDKMVVLTYVIRFDKKGYRFHDFEDVLKCYGEANKVERLIFTLESVESACSNKLNGTFIELKLDAKDSNNTLLTISSDNKNLVDVAFANISELLVMHKNKNHLIRHDWTQLVVQLLGVFTGFITSLWIAIKLAPHLKIQTPLVFSFLLIFLVFPTPGRILTNRYLDSLIIVFPMCDSNVVAKRLFIG